ncbi:MAG: hypothetical protein NQ108_21905 [Klebsiella aerogenes]|nr:hypothetical protein [Klebsiella aerogenes]
MKKNNSIILFSTSLIFILSVIAGKLIMSGINKYRETHFSCDANVVVLNKNNKLTMITTYFFEGDHGFVIIKGNLNHDDKTYNVSRKALFSIEKLQTVLSLNSTHVDISPGDNAPSELIEQILPSFFYKTNKTFEYSIYPRGWDGLVFSTGYIPLFYCHRF